METSLATNVACDHEKETNASFYDVIPEVVDELVSTWEHHESFDHIGPVPIPSHEKVVEIIFQSRRILFPGYFSRERICASSIKYAIGQETNQLYERLVGQVAMSIRHDCRRHNQDCSFCRERSHKIAIQFIKALPQISRVLATDIKAVQIGDPASKSYDEIIFSYPGLLAVTIYRLANFLYKLDVPIMPRIMTEHAHSLTGIDIHPGATIGKDFFIDHGTGVVIGETTEIGERVRLYQGVTLGALSLPPDAGISCRDTKRHPTIEDDVIVYANTTILGGDTIIGARSVIGGNIWLTESVPSDTKVLLKRPELMFK